jgi:hypothetical protein
MVRNNQDWNLQIILTLINNRIYFKIILALPFCNHPKKIALPISSLLRMIGHHSRCSSAEVGKLKAREKNYQLTPRNFHNLSRTKTTEKIIAITLLHFLFTFTWFFRNWIISESGCYQNIILKEWEKDIYLLLFHLSRDWIHHPWLRHR